MAVDVDDLAMLREAVYLFAGVYFCANLPANLKKQLAANKTTWRYVPGAGSAPGSWDGHAFDAVGYYENGDWDIRSWGKRFRMTKRFMQEYVYLVVRDPLEGRAPAREREEPAGHRPGDAEGRSREAVAPRGSTLPVPELRGLRLGLVAPAACRWPRACGRPRPWSLRNSTNVFALLAQSTSSRKPRRAAAGRA